MVDPLTSFLNQSQDRNLRGLNEPNVIFYDTSAALEQLAERLERYGYFRVHSWFGALSCFNLELPIFMVLGNEMSAELGSLLDQYCRGTALIEIIDSKGRRNYGNLKPNIPELFLLIKKNRDAGNRKNGPLIAA
jgi:hypothetical protein